MSEWKEFFTLFGICCIIGAIIFGFIFGVDRYNCHYKYRDFNPSWGLISGCMVIYNDKNVPSDSLRVMD